MAKFDDGRNVRFLDMGGRFVKADGSREEDLYKPDRLHLTPKGYRVWAEAMQRLFDEMVAGAAGGK